MIKAIAIDDEPFALEVIRQHCRSVPFINLQATFTNPDEAIRWLQENKADLLFLDIRMPDISGIDLLRKLNPTPLAIFTTAYSEHAVQSFELDALDYLLKPFSSERFMKACQKARQWMEFRSAAAKDTFIFIKTGYDQVRVSFDDICYIQSAGNYVQFILTDQKKILSRSTMAETSAMLPTDFFIRVHRQYTVNRRHITRIEKNTIYAGDTAIPIGPGYGVVADQLK